jgi:hypothetical protein
MSKKSRTARGRRSFAGGEKLLSLTEAEFTAEVVIPLLSALGATYLVYTHGVDEDGKDLVFMMKDLDQSDVLHVCQVKHTPFSGRSASSNDYSAVLRQLEKCKRHDAVNPLTKRSQAPDRVWLVSGHSIPLQSVLRAQQFVDELRRQGIKVIDGAKLIELLKLKLPSLYIKYCRPGDFETLIATAIDQHDELSIFTPGSQGTVSEIFVPLDFAPSNGYFRQLVDGLLDVREPKLPKKLSASAAEFLQDFCARKTDTSDRVAHQSKPATSQRIRVAVNERVAHVLRAYAKLQPRRKESYVGGVTGLLEELRRLETRCARLDEITGGSVFERGLGSSARREFKITGVSPLDLMQSSARLIIYGEPGAGKTFHTKALFKEASAARLSPIYYPCAGFRSANGGLVQNIVRYWERKGIYAADDIRSALASDDGLLILDGLDEVLAQHPGFLELIEPILTANPRLKVCLTCRSSYQIESRYEWNAVELSAFSTDQIRRFFKKWFRSDTGKAAIVLEFLSTHPHIAEAASSPMVATLLATLTQYDRHLPTTYADLYKERFDLLLDRWDLGKKVHRNVYAKDDKLVVIQDLAYLSHCKGRTYFDRSAFERSFLKVLGNVLSPDHTGPFLKELLQSNGVLIQESKDLFSFGHLSYQEYLVARHIRERSKAGNLAENITEPWWQQVARFYASIAGDVSSLIRKALGYHPNLFNTHGPYLRELVTLARYTSPSIVDYIDRARVGLGKRSPTEDWFASQSATAQNLVDKFQRSEAVDQSTALAAARHLGQESVPYFVNMLDAIYDKIMLRSHDEALYAASIKAILSALASLRSKSNSALYAVRRIEQIHFSNAKLRRGIRELISKITGPVDDHSGAVSN